MPAAIPLGVTAHLHTALSRLCTIRRPPQDSHTATGGPTNVTQLLSHPSLLPKATLGEALFWPATGQTPWKTVSDIRERLPSSPQQRADGRTGQTSVPTLGPQAPDQTEPHTTQGVRSEPSTTQASSRASFLNHCAWVSVDRTVYTWLPQCGT